MSPEPSLIDGTIVRISHGWYDVQTAESIVRCRLRGSLKKELIRPESLSRRPRVQTVKPLATTDPAAVGDRVRIDPRTQRIEAILPRRSEIARTAPDGTGRRDTLLANLDQAVLVFALAEPQPDLWQLDRFLVAAEEAELDTVICFNKTDLAPPDQRPEGLKVYARLGYPVLYTSATQKEGLAELRAALAGKISILCGPSGVGKSSLLNALQPGLNRRVEEVSDVTHKGRHATTQVELIPLDGGGWVADTPGLRQMDFWNIPPEDLHWYFREFEPYRNHCQFADCTHLHEPGCAVREAVDRGEIDLRRYLSFCQLREG